MSLSHIDRKNNPTMVDVSNKKVSFREALAQTIVILPPQVLELFQDGEIVSKKGAVFQTAIIAGTMAVKKTSDLIPFCHQMPIEACKIQISLNAEKEVIIECRVSVHHKTGVEMEAIVGANIAAITIYDMCKAMSHDIIIQETKLMSKTGGKRDFQRD